MNSRLMVLMLGTAFALAACEDEAEPVGQRGAPGAAAGGTPSRARGAAADESGPETADPQADGAQRPRPVLTREDFSLLTRDPFQTFLGAQVVEVEPDRPRAQRDVKLAGHNFEDLKLIAIVRSGRGIVPRALFLASDGKSQTVHQGEYFSRAEVLLAAVNRDYIEIEVVDEALASGLHMARGERRAIYLKNE